MYFDFISSNKDINFLKCLYSKDESRSFKSDLKNKFNENIKNCKVKKNVFIKDFSKLYFTNIYNDYKSKEEIEKKKII